MKEKLTIEKLIEEAKLFCNQESNFNNADLYGVTDGKAVGTFIEHKFGDYLDEKYIYTKGCSANGIDFPSEDIYTDIKVTSIKQPQSSCPFKFAKQKIYGLGYNILVFVYDKKDDPINKVAKLDFVSCTFIKKERTADYQTTFSLRQMIENKANSDDIIGYLMDRNIPADEITLNQLAEQILKNTPVQGYLTISNALQWRLQYGRIVMLKDKVDGIIRIVDKVNGNE
ncbi:MAG: restriction endonuclease [Ignavibacteria bacterium]|nr:restriction endonuclease [Ignavibacteria bacterium]